MTDDLHRNLGAHDAEIANLKERFAEMRDEMRAGFDAIDEKFAQLHSELQPMVNLANQVRGGWRVLASVAAIAGAIGAGLREFVAWWRG